VVTAKVQYNLASAKGYFTDHLAVGDYYEEGQKTAGQWFGQGAQNLKLIGHVKADDFVALCENQNPASTQHLTQRLKTTRQEEDRKTANRRIFYDFTFPPPQSVSIVALVAEDQRIIDSHHRALKMALQEFEQFAATRVRQQGANGQRITGNVIASLFTHDTSRALDPHLHTHCIVFNATYDPEEQRWKALENYEMLRARKYVENIYYHELARDLKSFGYYIQNRPRGDFEIEGVSDNLIERFSKRHGQIDDALDDLLAKKPELAVGNLKNLREALSTAERSRKIKDVSRIQLRALWDGQLEDSEKHALHQLIHSGTVEPTQPETEIALEALNWAEDHLFERRSAILEHELWQQALGRARGKALMLDALKN
jgi:conjugative relaxase-like TrwC/TraI family protein